MKISGRPRNVVLDEGSYPPAERGERGRGGISPVIYRTPVSTHPPDNATALDAAVANYFIITWCTNQPFDLLIAVLINWLAGPGLAFVAYPEGISMMPVAPFWSILFFIMLFTLGVDSQFAMLETVVTAVVDEFPELKRGRRKIAVIGVFCVTMFLLGLPQCSLVSIRCGYR